MCERSEPDMFSGSVDKLLKIVNLVKIDILKV